MSIMSTCNICISTFNKAKNSCVKCVYCEYDVCRECCETYLLSRMEEAHCMNCKKEWSRKILLENFTKKFVDTTYKKHKEEIYFDRERGLLPETQLILERNKKIEKIEDEIIKINDEIRQYRLRKFRYEQMIKDFKRCKDLVLCKIYVEKIKDIVLKINVLNQECDQLQIELEIIRNNEGTKKTRREFIRKCPAEDCRGFLSTQWKCGLCEKHTCSDCHELKEKDHVCKKENLEAAKMIENDTRPCPKCGTRIYKIDGCDQMWCTQCHTAFSWTTGNIELKIHNPHYFEWLRKNDKQERNPLDVQCGQEIDGHFLHELQKINMYNFMDGYDRRIQDEAICWSIIHMRAYDLGKYTDRKDNEDIRIRYLQNDLTETKFKQLLQKREKDYNKRREVLNILTMYMTAITDIMYRYMDELKSGNKDNALFQQYEIEILKLKEYVNSCLKDVAKVYKCQELYINNQYELKRVVKD